MASRQWRSIDGDAKNGLPVFLSRDNDCAWEYAVAWWTGTHPYPWQGDHNAWPEDRWSHYMHAFPPEAQ